MCGDCLVLGGAVEIVFCGFHLGVEVLSYVCAVFSSDWEGVVVVE